MAAAQALKQLEWDDQAIAALGVGLEASPWGGVKSINNVLTGCHLFELQQGNLHALIAVRGTEYDHGRSLDVIAARNLGARMPAAVLAPALDHLARTAYERVDQLAMCTRYPHIVRGCLRHGWAETGTVMVKNLRLQ